MTPDPDARTPPRPEPGPHHGAGRGSSATAPRCADLPYVMQQASRFVAERLATRGLQGWIVGGAVRDLILGRAVKDVDMASAATPDQVEGLFENVIAVGRAFGILVIPVQVPSREGSSETTRIEVELATFRTEDGYADARHPDTVTYARTLEEDAVRRDFTCNALYLDPRDDTFADPTGGLADLRSGRLRAVGDARARFREDGLRILRMARFLGQLGLTPHEDLIPAAVEAQNSLDGVSSERVLEELGRTLCTPHVAVAVEAWFASQALPHVLPTWWSAVHPKRMHRVERTAALSGAATRVDGLAIWLDPDPCGAGDLDAQATVLDSLPLSRVESRLIREAWVRRRELRDAVPDAARRVRLLDGPAGGLALRLATAWARATGASLQHLEDLARWRDEQGGEDLVPAPLLGGHELRELGVPAGPRLGELRDALIDAQLRGQLDSLDEARDWIRDQL